MFTILVILLICSIILNIFQAVKIVFLKEDLYILEGREDWMEAPPASSTPSVTASPGNRVVEEDDAWLAAAFGGCSTGRSSSKLDLDLSEKTQPNLIKRN